MQGKTILAFGYHNQQAPRHWNMKRDLEAEGYAVLECTTTPKKGMMGKWMDLHHQYRKVRREVDEVLVTFPGHFLMPLAWFLTRAPRKKLTFDAFISLYDSLVDDRGKYSKANPYAWFLYCMDYLACHMADEVFIDTEAQRQFFIQKFHLKPEKIRTVYLKARTDLFFPKETVKTQGRFEVFFYGTYIPLQGIEYIVRAAKIVEEKNPNVHFTLVGSGQTYEDIQKLSAELQNKNISFIERVPMEALPDMIRSSDLCLGIFGTSDKAARVIPHKVYDAVACGGTVLTEDSPAIREKFANDPHVLVCAAGNEQAIAEKILQRAA